MSSGLGISIGMRRMITLRLAFFFFWRELSLSSEEMVRGEPEEDREKAIRRGAMTPFI